MEREGAIFVVTEKKNSGKNIVREATTGKFLTGSKARVLTREAGIVKMSGTVKGKKAGGYSTRKHELVP